MIGPESTETERLRFSVVVVARSVEPFLKECLSSVQRQQDVHVEVIAVEDHSPDACGQIIDRFVDVDPRFVAVHRPRSAGVSAARNAGVDLASGEYVAFLDGDDLLHGDDVLAGLADDLAQTGEPDVLLFDYEEIRPCGLRRRSPSGRSLPADNAHLVASANRAETLRFSWVCWNKVYRRDYLERMGLRFPPGYYEDFAWSIPAILAAERLAVSGRVAVDYRRCRAASMSRAVTPRQLDVFDQFDRILALLHERPELDRSGVREALASSADAFLRSRIERLRVVPDDLRPEFARRSRELMARMRS